MIEKDLMQSNWDKFLEQLIQTSPWEGLAVLLGIVYVVLAAKEYILAWFFAFVSTLIYTVIFWEGALFSSSFLNFYYMLMAVYGYYAWSHGSDEKMLAITSYSLPKHFIIIGLGVVLSLMIGYLSTTYTDAKLAYLDSFVMLFSIITTWLLTQKVIENWLYWIVIDSVAILLYWKTDFLPTAVLFMIYVILAIYGYLTWRKKFCPIDLKPYSLLHHQKVEELSLLELQGHCNINYFLKTDQEEYLVRKFKHESDRKVEFLIQNLAAKQGVAARALHLDEENGLMICDFIQGEHLKQLTPQNITKLALTLQKLHKIKFMQKPTSLKGAFKYKHKQAYEAFKVIERYPPEYVLAHNDLHPKNILFGKKIQFIDWEYAGVTDRYFDLAAIIVEFKLNKKDQKRFLQTYFGRHRKVNHKKLEAYKMVYTTLWTVWFYKLERGQINLIT
jgi:nicotinamide mononucleotide transporter